MKDFIMCKIIAEYHLCFICKKTINVKPSYSLTKKNKVCNSHRTKTIGVGMNSTILPPVVCK